MTMSWIATALAGPVVEPTQEGVHSGLDAAWHLLWLLALVSVPLLAWLFHRRLQLLRQARAKADENETLP
jgi:hypothetical protein